MENKEISRDIINQISGYMRIGASFILSTAACGISEESAKRWELKANEANENKEDNIYRELFNAIRTAKAQAELVALQRLSAEGGAAGARWLLENINPEKYSKKKNKEIKESTKQEENTHANQDLISMLGL